MIAKRPVIVTADLFAAERARLLELLGGLEEDAWNRPTSCPGWSIKDLAAHVLGDDLNNLSGGRDGYSEVAFNPPDWAALVAFINQRNEAWVEALRRLSPGVLVDLLESSGARVRDYFAALDPMARGPNVAWAGSGPMPMWLHIAREYSERWLHQSQVREAAGAPMLYEPDLFHPVLDIFAHALPVAYAGTEAPEGTHVRVDVGGEGGGSWSLVRLSEGWALCEEVLTLPRTVVRLDQDTAWRLWTKGSSPERVRPDIAVEGDQALGEPVLHAVAIIA